ncbi:MAG: HAD family hydrolase [Zetaproteobacteria bacterium]|nr:MAG: HAD family hydrolase [Zetaproteobacteria bacterium]
MPPKGYAGQGGARKGTEGRRGVPNRISDGKRMGHTSSSRDEMKRYRAVLCDMFDTVVNFLWGRLPLVPFDGTEIRSSSPLVYEALRSVCPGVPLSDFCRAFIECSRAAESTRNLTQREVTAHQRFGMLRERLGIPDGSAANAFVEAAIAEQMRQLRRAMEFPEEHRAALARLHLAYRMAVVSNFDHGPTVEAALADFGIRDRFEAVVVSADVGWRKPHPEIFREALRRMGLEPAQAVFVGDTPEADVLGPHGVGLDTIWIDRGNALLPSGAAPPTYTVSSFADVASLL